MQSLTNGWELIKSANHIFINHPKLMIPLLVTWLLIAPVSLYLRFYYHSSGIEDALLTTAATLLYFSLVIAVSCSVLLEMIEQQEKNEEMRLLTALWHSFTHNFFRLLPITIVWAALWFIVTVITALLRSKKERNDDDMTPESAARFVSGNDSGFSLAGMTSSMIMKFIRMSVFLMLPAVCWEGRNSMDAFRRGWSMLKKNKGEFFTGFMLTELAAAIVFLPPALIFYLQEKAHINFPDYTWYGVIAYCGMAWSYCLYLEQMFCAELFLWHRKWEKESAKEENRGKSLSLSDVERPGLLDEVPDLVEFEMKAGF